MPYESFADTVPFLDTGTAGLLSQQLVVQDYVPLRAIVIGVIVMRVLMDGLELCLNVELWRRANWEGPPRMSLFLLLSGTGTGTGR